MSNTVANLVARLTFDGTQFTAGIAKAATATTSASAKMTAVGTQMSRGVTLPLVAIGAAATVMSMRYDEAFAHMEGLAGVPAAEIAGLRDQVMGLAHDTGQGPQALAEALYFIQSSGVKGAAAMEALDASARAATAGLGSVQVVADAVTSAVNAYGQENLTAADAVNVMVGAVREGKGEADEIAGTLGRIIPIASQLGVSFVQVGAGMAGLTRIGLSAAESATALRAIMTSLLSPSQAAREAFASAGTSAGQLRAEIADKGLLTTLLDLRERFHGNAEAMGAAFGNVRALNGVMGLIGGNADEVAAIFENLSGDTDYLGEAFDAVAKTDGFKVKQALSDIQVALIQLGDVIVPVVGSIASGVSDLASGISNLPGPVQTVVVGLGAFVAAAGPTLMVSGALVNSWRTLAASASSAATATEGAAAANATAAGRLGSGGLAMVGLAGAAMAVSGVIRLFADDTRNTTGAVDAFTAALRSSGDAADGLGAAMQALRSDEAAAGADELAAAMEAAGLGAEDLRAALEGPEGGLEAFAQRLVDTGAITERELSNIDKGFNALFDTPFTTATEIVPTSAFDRTRNALTDLQGAMDQARSSEEVLNATGLNTSGTDAQTGAMGELDLAADSAASSMDELKSAWSGLQSALSASDAELAARDALRSLADAVAKAGEDGTTTAAELDGVHQSVNKLADSLMQQAEAANTAADGTVDVDAANRDLLQSMQYLLSAGSIPAALVPEWQALIDTIDQPATVDVSAPNAYPTRDQLIEVYVAAVEATRRVDVTTAAPGSTAAAADLNSVKAAADRIPGHYPAYVDTIVERAAFDRLVRDLDAADNKRFTAQLSVSTSGGPGAFYGGPVPGARSEAVPMTLHGGEYVLSADVVDRIRRGEHSRGARMGNGLEEATGTGGGGGGTTVVLARTIAEALKHVPKDARREVADFLNGRS